MCDVKVSVYFRKCSELVAEVAALTIHTELFTVELTTVLRFVFVTLANRFTLIVIHRKADEFFYTVRIIAVCSVVTVTGISHVLAKFSPHHRKLHLLRYKVRGLTRLESNTLVAGEL